MPTSTDEQNWACEHQQQQVNDLVEEPHGIRNRGKGRTCLIIPTTAGFWPVSVDPTRVPSRLQCILASGARNQAEETDPIKRSRLACVSDLQTRRDFAADRKHLVGEPKCRFSHTHLVNSAHAGRKPLICS